MKNFKITVKYVNGIFIAQNLKLRVQFYEIPNMRRYKHMRYIYGITTYSLSYRRRKHNNCDEKDNEHDDDYNNSAESNIFICNLINSNIVLI